MEGAVRIRSPRSLQAHSPCFLCCSEDEAMSEGRGLEGAAGRLREENERLASQAVHLQAHSGKRSSSYSSRRWRKCRCSSSYST